MIIRSIKSEFNKKDRQVSMELKKEIRKISRTILPYYTNGRKPWLIVIVNYNNERKELVHVLKNI